MNILFAASECNPFVKTGGLADVLGALPQALSSLLNESSRAHRIDKNSSKIVVILPKYQAINNSKFRLERVPGKLLVPIADKKEQGKVWRLKPGQKNVPSNVDFYFLENTNYFDRMGLYGYNSGNYADNDERFIFYARAVLECCKLIQFSPDIVHAHDWQAGLIPCYLKTLYRADPIFAHAASIFTIHNIAYQGLFPKTAFLKTAIPLSEFVPEKLEYFDQINFMKAGLVYADQISTVSPSYAEEICQSNEFGCGMEGVLTLRKNNLSGILNALDSREWNPAQDPHIAKNFSAISKNLFLDRAACKKDLQKSAGLNLEEDACLIGMVSRLDRQKGFNFLQEIVPSLMQKKINLQWIVLGVGDKSIQQSLQALAQKYPGQFALDTRFNIPLGHQVYAGCDIFFMPSLFEPCGISQMIAMRYGAVPVVTSTGGLKDTVTNATGFLSTERSKTSIEKTLCRALETYKDKPVWQTLMRNAMQKKFSWKESAQQYIKLYDRALAHYPVNF